LTGFGQMTALCGLLVLASSQHMHIPCESVLRIGEPTDHSYML
jgi:hypothetical protein